MSNRRPVSIEIHHAVEQFLYREARMLDSEGFREWVDTFVDPQISYQMVIQEERFRADQRPPQATEMLPFDDDYRMLSIRVQQFETGLQTMLDPPARLRRFVSNVEVYHCDNEAEYLVLSYGIVSRIRRLYDNEQIVFGREDILRKADDGNFRLLSRRINLDERVIRSKNLLFFL